MKVLVTGGDSFIGLYVVAALADRGEQVISYDRSPSGSQDDRVETALGELFDLPRLLHVIREHAVGRIVHAAGLSHPRTSVEMPPATAAATVASTLHLLEAARLTGLKGRVVLFSSNVVYGDNDTPIDESSPVRPRTPYAVAKVTTELLGGVYTELYGLDVVALRLGEPYGPGLTHPTMFRVLMTAAATAKPFRAPAGADQTVHLIHGEDVSRAVLAALDTREPKQRVYNITGGESHSLSQVAALIRGRFPDSRIDLGPGHLPELERQGAIDIRAADHELGYRPRWGLARGIDDFAEWILAQRDAA